jgi:multiple sugar transport system substrate-binding protein
VGSGALAASAAFGGSSLLESAKAWAADSPFKPERGARLRLLRYARFVESEEKAFTANVQAFSEATGIPVRIDTAFVDDIQPKASVAANVGAGPDIVWGSLGLAHLFPDKLVDMTDVADYLGDKYGGWYDAAKIYGMYRGRWISIPIGISGGSFITYRKSMMTAAGFAKPPATTDELLKMAEAMKASGNAGGLTLAHASGDGNIWTHWLVWAFGGKVVDENNRVAINSPETIRALEYARELHQYFPPGVGGWSDGHNNKAILSGQIGWTFNGISIYAAAAAQKIAFADDIWFSYTPVGPVGRPMELHQAYPLMAFRYTEYPNACRALLAFLMEKPQYDKWLEGSVGYFSHTLKAYNVHPVWNDPRREPFRDSSARTVPFSYAGDINFAAAATLADFVMVDMVSSAAAGQATPKEAVELAEKRAKRYYEV